MNKKILILGKGFIGSRIQQALGFAVSDGLINTFSDAQALIRKFNPEVIINSIGFTGRNVDDCETDISQTLLANSFVPIILAEAALRNKIRLVHISSGCIYHYDYSRESPIAEEKVPDFFDLFYSRSKIYSEQPLNILARSYPILILRIRIPLDNRPHPKNILTKLINYKKVIDIPNSITYIPDFIQALRHLIETDARGIYNVSNKGGLRYPELLEVYKKYVPAFEYTLIDYKQLNLTRTNLVLSTRKLEESGFKLRDIHEVLEECVCQYLKSS
jgi:3,5-epimerase/4-reductase